MPRKLIPDYRLFKPANLACVDLSGKRFYLGRYGSPRSRERYNWLIGEWIKSGRTQAPKPPAGFFEDEPSAAQAPIFIPVARIAAAYMRHLRRTKPVQGGRFKDYWNVRATMRLMRDELKHVNGHELHVAHLEQLQLAMVGQDWNKTTIRGRMRHFRLALRHASKYRLIADTILIELSKIDPLSNDTKGLRQPEKVTPAAPEVVDAILPLASTPIAGMIRFGLLTGARPGEVCQLRRRDIDTSGPVWVFRPAKHKTQRLGKDRTIVIGPQAQKVIEPFLAGSGADDYVFSPVKAVEERHAKQAAKRKTPLRQGNRPGSNLKANPKKQPGQKYTTNSFRIAIARLCKKAGVEPFHPHQLRHAAATRIRREAGLEAAALVVGHGSALITDAVYAERDLNTMTEIVWRIG